MFMLISKTKLRNVFIQSGRVYASPLARRIALGVVFFGLFTVSLAAEFLPEKVSFQEGQVSDRDVVAPRTVSYVDQEKTKKLEAEVLASVASVYDIDVSVMAKTEDDVSAIYRAARMAVREKAAVTKDKPIDRKQLIAHIQAVSPLQLPSTAVSSLLEMDEIDLNRAEEATKTILRKYFQRGIKEDELPIVRKHVVIEAEEMGLGKNAEAAVAGISQALLRPNFILNVRETDKRKQMALSGIEPVRETVKKGQILVRKGDVVTAEQIRVMEALGLYAGQINEMRIVGLSVFVLAVMAIMLGFLYKFAPAVWRSDAYLILIGLIALLTILLGKAAHFYSDFAAPLATGALLTAILIDARVGVFFSIISALLFGVIADHDLRAVVVPLVGSIAGVFSVSRSVHGYSLIRTGLCIAGINFIIIWSTGVIEQLPLGQVLMQGLAGIFGGIAAAVIATGILPYLEHAFNITTPMKLLDYAKPNHPLLARLLLDAPGTYHHSVLVGNLAETSADVIGADPVVVRVGSYYHDIGKIKRPYFFVENQEGPENPHDKISPTLSTLIITSHIKDGVELCREYRLPRIIVDIVQQHHGTSLVSYFYKRATENEHSECIIEADFRYDGPRPQTKEAALIMLADACEAAVRSLGKPNVNRIEATVRRVIRERLHDGQLDDCSLTLRDLNIIGDVFIRVLSSMFHSRIEYPEDVPNLRELEKRRVKNGNCYKLSSGRDISDSSSGAACN